MANKIVWEHMHNEPAEEDEILDDDLEEESIYDDYEEVEPIQLIATPFGLCRVNDKYNPLRQFVWWIAHTNFNVSANVLEKLKNVPGIELLRISTRYRFMVAIGKAFNFSDVRKEIEKALDVITNNVVNESVLFKELDDKHEKWAVLFGNDTYMTAVDDEYETGMTEFTDYLKNNKGKIVTHNEFRGSSTR